MVILTLTLYSMQNDRLQHGQGLDRKFLLWLQNFWKFSLFYGAYLGSLHRHNKAEI